MANNSRHVSAQMPIRQKEMMTAMKLALAALRHAPKLGPFGEDAKRLLEITIADASTINIEIPISDGDDDWVAVEAEVSKPALEQLTSAANKWKNNPPTREKGGK